MQVLNKKQAVVLKTPPSVYGT